MISLYIIYFLLGVVSAYRLARLFIDDTIFEPVRRHLYVETVQGSAYRKNKVLFMLGKLFNCYWCMGFWTSVIVTVLYTYDVTLFVYVSTVLTSSTLVALIHEMVKRVEQ